MAAWVYRVIKGEDGTLHFGMLRYRDFETKPCGLAGLINEGQSVDDMRDLVRSLQVACNKPIYDLANPSDEDEDEDEWHECD